VPRTLQNFISSLFAVFSTEQSDRIGQMKQCQCVCAVIVAELIEVYVRSFTWSSSSSPASSWRSLSVQVAHWRPVATASTADAYWSSSPVCWWRVYSSQACSRSPLLQEPQVVHTGNYYGRNYSDIHAHVAHALFCLKQAAKWTTTQTYC